MTDSFEDFRAFLYESPTETLEMCYSVGGKLVAVGIVDLCPGGLSSVYLSFDPDEARRSLGVFAALREIEECRSRGLAWWHAGYYVRDCRKMSYKADFRPNEVLGEDGCWGPSVEPRGACSRGVAG